jgi:hypothetical protein
VVQLVVDGNQQQIVYIQNYRLPFVTAIYLKDILTEEAFVRTKTISESGYQLRIDKGLRLI